MRHALAPVAALLLSAAVLLTGQGLQLALLPVRAQAELFSTVAIGGLGSAYFLGFALGCLFGPQLIRKAGHIRTFTAMTAVASAAPLLHALILLPGPWMALRATTGFCFATLYIVIESWLNERSTNDTRGLVLSVYLIINLSVITVGQMLITTYAPSGFELFALASIIVSLAAVPVALNATAAPAPVQSVRVRPLHIYHISPLGFAATVGVGLANGAWWSLAPLYATRAGQDVASVALFMSATVIGGALGQWPIGRLSDRMDRRRVLVGTCLAAAAMGSAMYLYADRLGAALPLLGLLWGAFAFPLYSVALAHTNDFAAPDEFVEVSSGLLLVYAVGAMIGPIMASAAMSHYGGGGLYAFAAGTHLLVATFCVWRMSRRAAVPVAEHLPFADALQATQTVSQVFDSQTQQSLEADARQTSAEAEGTTPEHR